MVFCGQAFSPDGATLAAAYTNWLYLWDVADPAPGPAAGGPAVPRGSAPALVRLSRDIAFSPDGRTLAGTTSHNQVGLWDVASPARVTRLATLGGHTAPVAAIAFARAAPAHRRGRRHRHCVRHHRSGAPRTHATMPAVAAHNDSRRRLLRRRLHARVHPRRATLTAIASTTAPSAGPATTAAEKVSRWRVTSTARSPPRRHRTQHRARERPARPGPQRHHPGARRPAWRQHDRPIGTALTHHSNAPPGHSGPKSATSPTGYGHTQAGKRSYRARQPDARTRRTDAGIATSRRPRTQVTPGAGSARGVPQRGRTADLLTPPPPSSWTRHARTRRSVLHRHAALDIGWARGFRIIFGAASATR